MEANPYTSHTVSGVSLSAPHSSLWTCRPTLKSAVPACGSSSLPSSSDPKASTSLVFQVRAGYSGHLCHTFTG